MSNFIVAVPTRDRLSRVKLFVESFLDTTTSKNRPKLLFIHDLPTKSDSVSFTEKVSDKSIVYNEKSSLAKLWNKCIIESEKISEKSKYDNWILICNDDAVFKNGWIEYLNSQIDILNPKYLQINLLHYGAFCIHKKMLLLNGYFDERFKGGGFEDNDWQLRLYEGELKRFVDRKKDYVFMEHRKFSDGTNWLGENNSIWICEKWGRKTYLNWKIPSYRKYGEVDWYPEYTKKLEDRYGLSNQIYKINLRVNSNKRIFH